jgi:hypothetical protein
MDIPIKDKLGEPGTRHPARSTGHAHISGWGADLDHSNRPAYPMERRPPRLEAQPPGSIEQQARDPRVFHSIERTGLTPVFGTTCPPRGISGFLRRRAFGYSEGDLRHWLMLLLADRVDMVEGIASDLARGHIPNVYREMGGPAELRHNPRGAAKKALMLAAAAGLCYWAWKRSSSRHR